MILAALALLVTQADAPAGDDEAQHAPLRAPLPTADEIAALPPDGGPEFNRLVFSKSPYLLQHARNPVDWHEWGPEPFALAEKRGVPVFLSIGYSTCHWCHVMEHESFEDDEVAKLMNEAFVCIKLDREERPDIDQLYMTVTQSMTGRGGWPMTVVMTPDKKPFFAGTYFPKTTVGQRYGMVDLVPAISNAWEEQHEAVLASADEVTRRLRLVSSGAPGEMLSVPALEKAEADLARSYDALHGGFGARPKFPVPHQLRFLLRRHAATGSAETLAMVTRTLEAWRLGGIFDHVGLGMHRYSTDERYLLPHFEKMLYDQALCAMAYVDAWQVTRDPALERAAREILAYVARDMTSPAGAFYSAEDADSEGEEGLFYLWTPAQVRALLGDDDGAWVVERFSLTDEGNFRDESTGQPNGKSIPHLTTPLTDEERARWEPLRQRLFAVREARIHPLKDDKVLTDWNGLAVAAFARAGRAFGDDELVARARRAAVFLSKHLVTDDGRLLKRWRGGEAGLDAMLDDHAYVAWGLLALFEADHDPAHLALARSVVDVAIEHFWDDEGGGFYLSPDDGEALIVRAKEAYDGARPSGNSTMAVVLTRLARLTGEPAYEARAVRTVEAFAADVSQQPSSHSHMLGAVDAHVRGGREIVIVGTRGDADTEAMLRLAAERYAPNDVLLLRPPGGVSAGEPAHALASVVPFVAPLAQIDGVATAYVCTDFTCEAPVSSVAALRELLGPREEPAEPGSTRQDPDEAADGEDGQ